jgi:hypothetical protein
MVFSRTGGRPPLRRSRRYERGTLERALSVLIQVVGPADQRLHLAAAVATLLAWKGGKDAELLQNESRGSRTQNGRQTALHIRVGRGP